MAKGYSTSCPAGGVDFNVTSIVVNAASGGWNDATLGLRATSETDTYAWKKFQNNRPAQHPLRAVGRRRR